MTAYTEDAQEQVDDLADHYEKLERIEALRNLYRAMADAEDRIEREPGAGLPSPRPYPECQRPGVLWILSGSYWVAYAATRNLIVGVFYASGDIPRRF